jgi:hypothetical protein
MGRASAPRRYRINDSFEPVITVESDVTKYDELVYLLVANRPLPRKKGTSRIAYIGKTASGVSRIAQSAADKIVSTLECHGVRRLRAFVVWAKPRRYERTDLPHLLERGLLLTFRDEFGELPRFNLMGVGMKWGAETDYFRAEALHRIVIRYS